eukprot:CAMPEP_0204899484 /NCGR_PEP_ID=MMETSP1397-20131031/1885_1 /ASSEMBLY_ACC=CAM_ASM_000891 /TAXON_ID=49980 /ORGANISM="Climacostomum Climacostomum virens, Strain Stock W-24" /LENGTH=237 /DNA_ID=CAMNT_0052067451 /DNA_START=189 /DNA_END=902 /DNA_ORIENTATION=+
MVKSLFRSESLSPPQLRLPPFNSLFAMQAQSRQLNEKVIGTLEAELEKQTEIEMRIRKLSKEIEALSSDESSHSEVCSESPLMNSLSVVLDSFPFKLELAETLMSHFVKGKYFDLKLEMTGSPGVLPWAILIEISAYTSDSPPKQIFKNLAGDPIFNGEQRAFLQYSSLLKKWGASFKLRLNEVTSRFKDGWIFLVVQAFGSKHSSLIKPLIIEPVVVKAKVNPNRVRRRSRVKPAQ